MKRIVIKISDELYNDIAPDDAVYYPDDGGVVWQAVREGTVLPDNPTNGEVIQALFPNIYEGFSNVIDLNLWWYAKYKAKEQEK